ncbi:MAG: MotA/TolQ/ExbB proton channel family protein [Sorangiineae bacterium]|nr:MotA/TolQ/ExbB proton channel family protein [Polyangiaceae bacterium]MEB2320991.1 MotA/TolQ/ExbB proton channel family protein [Sorangiineae bacterium]
MELETLLSVFAHLGARWVFWLLVAMSVAGVAVAFERAAFLLGTRDDVGRLRADVARLLARGDVELARRRLEESPAVEARIARAGLSAGMAGADERMRAEEQMARLDMEKHLSILGTLGANAPFVGLLGTVIGIIRAFRELEAHGGLVSSGLLTEVGEALVATAVGLLVALPAIAFFNLFQRVIRARLGRAQALGFEVLAFLAARADARGAG